MVLETFPHLHNHKLDMMIFFNLMDDMFLNDVLDPHVHFSEIFITF